MIPQGTLTSEVARLRKAMSCLIICFLLILFSIHLFSLNSQKLKYQSIQAMYVFGDSLVDSGNNNYLPRENKAKFLPYGIDFDGGKPTGRYTNGKTIADFIALLFGLPLIPPYLGLSEFQRRNITTGVNYASASAGILPETAHNDGMCLAFDNQIELFQRTVENDLPKHFKNQSDLDMHLSESLFLVSFGTNDYSLYRNRCMNGTKQCLGPEVFSQLLLNELLIRLQRLYILGARKFLVNNVPPTWFFPAEVIKISPKRDSNKDKIKMVNFHNRKLPQMLKRLQSQLPGARFAYSDYFKFLWELKATATRFGIIETWKPCCPDNYNGTIDCHPNSTSCTRRDTYLFFDELHPSQIANDIYARRCFDDLSICTILR